MWRVKASSLHLWKFYPWVVPISLPSGLKKWINVDKLGNFNWGKSLFECFLRVNYLTFCNSVSTSSSHLSSIWSQSHSVYAPPICFPLCTGHQNGPHLSFILYCISFQHVLEEAFIETLYTNLGRRVSFWWKFKSILHSWFV